MALAGQRSLLELYRQDNLFPSFRGGFTAVARDESRHVIFGVKFLRDMIQQDPAHAKTVYATIERYAPIALTALMPSEEAIPSYVGNAARSLDDTALCTGITAQETKG